MQPIMTILSLDYTSFEDIAIKIANHIQTPESHLQTEGQDPS